MTALITATVTSPKLDEPRIFKADTPRDICIELEDFIRDMGTDEMKVHFYSEFPVFLQNAASYLADLMKEINHDEQIGV